MDSSKKTDYGNWIPRKLMNALWGIFLGVLLLLIVNALFWRNAGAALLLGALSGLSLVAAVYMQYCRKTIDLRGGGLAGKFYDDLLDHLAWQGQGRLLDIGCGCRSAARAASPARRLSASITGAACGITRKSNARRTPDSKAATAGSISGTATRPVWNSPMKVSTPSSAVLSFTR